MRRRGMKLCRIRRLLQRGHQSPLRRTCHRHPRRQGRTQNRRRSPCRLLRRRPRNPMARLCRKLQRRPPHSIHLPPSRRRRPARGQRRPTGSRSRCRLAPTRTKPARRCRAPLCFCAEESGTRCPRWHLTHRRSRPPPHGARPGPRRCPMSWKPGAAPVLAPAVMRRTRSPRRPNLLARHWTPAIRLRGPAPSSQTPPHGKLLSRRVGRKTRRKQRPRLTSIRRHEPPAVGARGPMRATRAPQPLAPRPAPRWAALSTSCSATSVNHRRTVRSPANRPIAQPTMRPVDLARYLCCPTAANPPSSPQRSGARSGDRRPCASPCAWVPCCCWLRLGCRWR